MDLAAYNAFCASLPAAEHAVPWPDDHVWKVGGKMFAAAHQKPEAGFATISFKVPDDVFEVLSGEPGLRPAPYLARAKWVQLERAGALSDAQIEAYIAGSHGLYAAKLTKKVRRELELD